MAPPARGELHGFGHRGDERRCPRSIARFSVGPTASRSFTARDRGFSRTRSTSVWPRCRLSLHSGSTRKTQGLRGCTSNRPNVFVP